MKATMRLRGVRVLLLGVVVAGTACIVPTGASAQGRMSPAERMAQRVDTLTARLQLTPQQVAQLKPILQKQSDDMRTMMQEARQGGNMDFAAMRPRMEKMRTDTDKAIEAILTPAQKTSYEALVKEEAARRASRMGGRGGGG